MIVLPYQHVLLLLKILAELESQRDLEVALRCIFILIETHYLQMIADQDNLELLKKLSSMSKQRMSQERDLFGYNVAAVKVMKNQLTPQNSFESKKLPVKKVKVTV
jgi:U3 small nucleolar RNA-associated protein 12